MTKTITGLSYVCLSKLRFSVELIYKEHLTQVNTEVEYFIHIYINNID